MEDIGYTLFVQLLGMTQYPGSPFTGNIVNDIIMFFLVPSIFIIMIVYITVGRIFVSEHIRMRVMLGLGMYLFIIAGGYYPAFALLSGPYFLFLIFIMGILYFFVEHFVGRAPPQAGAGGGGGAGGHFQRMIGASGMKRATNPFLEDRYKGIISTIATVEAGGKVDNAESLGKLHQEKVELEIEMFGRRLSKHDIKQRYGIELKH